MQYISDSKKGVLVELALHRVRAQTAARCKQILSTRGVVRHWRLSVLGVSPCDDAVAAGVGAAEAVGVVHFVRLGAVELAHVAHQLALFTHPWRV